MTSTEKKFVGLGVIVAIGFLAWRADRESKLDVGDTVTDLSFGSFIANAIGVFKAPGNATAVPSRPPSPGSNANPIAPPSTPTKTAQPEGPNVILLGDAKFLPNLGDPNFSAYDYLASMPPDLAWKL